MSVDQMVEWLAPDAAPGAYNDWRLISGADWAPGVMYLMGALLVVALGLSLVGVWRLSRRRCVELMSWRLSLGVLILFLLLQPTIELRAISRVRSRIAVLLDVSRSMDLASDRGTREELVLQHLQQNQTTFRELSQKASIEWHAFDSRSRPIDEMPTELLPEGVSSDLVRALREVSWQGAGRELGAIILYSDGADTEGLTDATALRESANLGIPIYTVGFDEDATAPDVAIRPIPSRDFAFVHNNVQIDVDLEARGLQVREVSVALKQDGHVLQTKSARFDKGQAQVGFSFKPRAIGKQVYQVSVPIQAGETVKTNNQRSFVLRVIRDRIRVLQVAGRPSWDQRFLRELLKRNPNVDLISFFILRSTTDLQKASQDELALIPFPVNELFTEELETFDVVIYQNFSYRPYRMDRYLPNIRDYVLRGGGFMMVGGDQSFEDGWYANTAVADILPTRLGGAMLWDSASYRPRLTTDGRVHPITSIAEAGEPLDAAFARLPLLQGMNSSLGLMPNASALLTHPSLPGNPPVVAVREVEKGRTLSVSTDSLWFWRFVAVSDGGTGREFDRFWSNALRWLIKDPELDRVRLQVSRSVIAKGDAAHVEVEVLGPNYRPLVGTTVKLRLVRVSAKTFQQHEMEGGVTDLPDEHELVTGAEGTAVERFSNLSPGTYIIKAEAFDAYGRHIGEAKEPLIVESADIEFQLPFPRPGILQALSKGSKGKYVPINEALPSIQFKDERRVEVNRSRQVPIWNTYVFLLLLLVLAGTEWWRRRQSGLL
ncbi:MAG: glutamine amidotransferase [Myxococcales bacterium]|nr:glutamine amidotransferase [Myxococcales bacterium]